MNEELKGNVDESSQSVGTDAQSPASSDAQIQPSPQEGQAPVAPAAGAKAALGARIGGALIDAIVAFVLSFLVGMILPFDPAGMITWAVVAAYWVTRDSLPFLGGQSLGKKVVKLKVVKESGGDLVNDWQNAILRNVLLIVPFGGLVELVVLLIRQGKPEAGKRLGDDWAKTRVVVAG